MKKISRLRKKAIMDPSVFEGTLDQISDKGRAILKAIEEYKFYIDQTLRMIKTNPALSNLITQKKKNLDHAAQDLYSIVFEIENIDILEEYKKQLEMIEQNNQPQNNENKDDNNNSPQNNINNQQNPNQQPNNGLNNNQINQHLNNQVNQQNNTNNQQNNQNTNNQQKPNIPVAPNKNEK